MKTRERIISSVIDAFNEKGYHAFSLADLAQKCNMSRGNLAYHYKYKEDILDDISVKMVRDINRFLKKRIDYPAFYNLNLDIRTCRFLQEKYTFVFSDMTILEHDSIKEVLTKWSKDIIKRNLNAFAYGIEIGNVKPEPYEGLYYQLSVNAWLITYNWLAQKYVRQIGDLEKAERMVWSTIIPHFTEKGMEAFLAYYGQEFISNFGIPIKQYMELKHLF